MKIGNLFNLNGKTALVTGGSQGIGKAISLGLAEYGANIVINYRSGKELAEQTADEISKMGVKCWLFQCDLAQSGSAKSITGFLKDQHVEIDILVLNASVQVRKSWNEVTAEEFELQINTNLRASLFLIRELFPYMQQKKWGRICDRRQCAANSSASENDSLCCFQSCPIQYGKKPRPSVWATRGYHQQSGARDNSYRTQMQRYLRMRLTEEASKQKYRWDTLVNLPTVPQRPCYSVRMPGNILPVRIFSLTEDLV